MNILVTGVSGFVGQELIQLLYQMENFSLTVLSRRIVNTLPQEIKQLIGEDIFSLQWSDEIDVVIHLAGRAHILNEQTTDPLTEFRKVNVEGTLQLARQALDKKVKRFIFMSSIGVNGSVTSQEPFTEDALPKPHADYAVSKLEAEQELKKLFAG